MPSQHKAAPYRVRLPEAVRLRLMARLERTGEPVNKVISEAVREKLDREEQEGIMSISDERIAEILAEANRVSEGAGEAVIMRLPEYDAAATAAAYEETEDLYVLTDGTVIDGEGEGWRARR